MSLDPWVYVLCAGSTMPAMVARCYPGPVRLRLFSSAADLLTACAQTSPLLVIAEVPNGHEAWVSALHRISDLPNAPRRMFFAEPGMLEEVMSETFSPGVDSLVLWPCDDADFREAVRSMFVTTPAPLPAQIHLPILPLE